MEEKLKAISETFGYFELVFMDWGEKGQWLFRDGTDEGHNVEVEVIGASPSEVIEFVYKRHCKQSTT